MPPALFLTWIEHRRTQHLCHRLELPLVELITPHRGMRRYLTLALRTVRTLVQRRPKVLIVQSPSVVLALLSLILRPIFRYRLVIDAHNEAIEPYLHPSWVMRHITYLLLRKADLTIVTNQQLAINVHGHGGRALVLPDSIPLPPPTTPANLTGPFKMVLISTFAGDEPFDVVVKAMHRLNEEVHLYVTGNPAKLPQEVRNSLPGNMTLTGFLNEGDYWSTLAACDAIMDLTTMDNCLVCGAYEGVAVGRPLLLSRNNASVELFSEFAVFTDNTPGDLIEAIETIKSQHANMLSSMPAARLRFEKQWSARAEQLLQFIAASDGHAPSIA